MKLFLTLLFLVYSLEASPLDNYPTGACNRSSHFLISFLAVLLSNHVLYQLGVPKNQRLLASGAFAISLGIFKETIDDRFDHGDFFADLLGTDAGMLVIYHF